MRTIRVNYLNNICKSIIIPLFNTYYKQFKSGNHKQNSILLLKLFKQIIVNMCNFLFKIKHLFNEKHIQVLFENISLIESFHNNIKNGLEVSLYGEDVKQYLLNKVDIILKLLY